MYLTPPLRGLPSNFLMAGALKKLVPCSYPTVKEFENMCIQTDGQTDGQTD